MIILAVDAGRTSGWALFDDEKLRAFGQFAVNDDDYVLIRLDNIFKGRDGYPGERGPAYPAMAIVEEHSAAYHVTHGQRGSRSVGENAIKRSMTVNIACRRRVEAALLKLGIPSLGVTSEEWGAGENITTAARAELELVGIVVPPNFYQGSREHERDAIAMGGRCIRRRFWEVR